MPGEPTPINPAVGRCAASWAQEEEEGVGGGSRSAVQTTIGGGGRRGEEQKRRSVSSRPVADTKSAFVSLPGCQIKEFLCVGGSDRVYLTLQLLL